MKVLKVAEEINDSHIYTRYKCLDEKLVLPMEDCVNPKLYKDRFCTFYPVSIVNKNGAIEKVVAGDEFTDSILKAFTVQNSEKCRNDIERLSEKNRELFNRNKEISKRNDEMRIQNSNLRYELAQAKRPLLVKIFDYFIKNKKR